MNSTTPTEGNHEVHETHEYKIWNNAPISARSWSAGTRHRFGAAGLVTPQRATGRPVGTHRPPQLRDRHVGAIQRTPSPATPLCALCALFWLTLLFAGNASAATNYVWQGSPSPTPPYSSWETAAHVIQDAVDVATDGDTVLVTNGVYTTGGRAIYGTMTNRVAVDKPLRMLSVNGPAETIIQGFQDATPPFEAVRCVYLTNGATLSGFTLTNGGTLAEGDLFREQSGAGAWCESTAVVITNCFLIGNSARSSLNPNAGFAGGAYRGTLIHCELRGNSAHDGAGAYAAVLRSCLLADNSTRHPDGLIGRGGGASASELSQCTLVGNTAAFGGGVRGGTLVNCITYYNHATVGANHDIATMNHSCTTPLPSTGSGNITNTPLFVDTNGWSSARLQPNSPCIDVGDNASATEPTDLDGNPRIINGIVDMGAYESRPASLDTHYVNIANPSPVAPYTNWGTAATNIQDAVDAACAGDTVLVTNGVYATGGRADAGLPITNITVRVAVDERISLLSVNGPTATTIVGPDGLRPDGNFSFFGRCVYLTSGARLSGFTLTNSNGGVLCASTNSVVSNCVIAANRGVGGATGGTLIDCKLAGNSARFGGGAYRATLINCLVVSNSAFYSGGGGGDLGGGACESVLIDCVIIGNDAGRGGGVYDCDLSGCTLQENTAYEGAGAYDSTLVQCLLTGNGAFTAGGGARESILDYCVLTANIARAGGGAVGSMLSYCTLAENSAFAGGGVVSGELNNCVLVGNKAENVGGGAAGGTTLNNCILVGNSAGRGGGTAGGTLNNCVAYFNTALENLNYAELSFEEINFTCTYPMPTNGVGNITNAPLFVDTNNWADLRLQPNSPCIDAGNNDFVTWDTDLDGNPRILNGIVDMGAYEFVPMSPPTPAELVEHLIQLVNESDLRHKRPLLATLEAALASIERNNCHSAEGQLGAFQNKVTAQVYRQDAALATELIAGADQAITALDCDGSPRVAARIHSLKRHPNGKMQMKIKGEAGKSYMLEASTNLVDWEAICVVHPDEDEDYEFEDKGAAHLPCRFYRLVDTQGAP